MKFSETYVDNNFHRTGWYIFWQITRGRIYAGNDINWFWIFTWTFCVRINMPLLFYTNNKYIRFGNRDFQVGEQILVSE